MNKKRSMDSEKVLQLLMDNKAIVILVIFVAIVSFLTDDFFSSRNLTNILRQICTSCTLSLGFTLVLASGMIDLSVGYMLGMIGIATAMMSVAGVSAPVVIISALAIGGFCGFLNAFITSAFNLAPFIVTLATGMIYQGVNLLLCNSRSVAGLPDWYLFFGTGEIAGIPFPVIVMVVLVIIMAIVVQRTKFGRYALACGGNSKAARVCGIPTKKIMYSVYIITGVCVGMAALLLTGRTASAQTGAGAGMELDAVAAVVIGGTPMEGGKANVFGTLIGCLLIQVISNSLNLLGVDSNWQKIAKGLVIIVAIILDRQGTKLLDMIRVKKVQEA
ncbi:ABC transporter permease [Clostridium sp. Marseille-P3244]|uniref:ABC transporter permease n=1 Tax=Clostridium sp. Marseille-P3244 TaxID=1871020 RepID=UPI0009F88703|nr:ABC transporter permease [Clostridium sp. Marseille-P3244]